MIYYGRYGLLLLKIVPQQLIDTVDDAKIGKHYACHLHDTIKITNKLYNNKPEESCEDQLNRISIISDLKKRPHQDW